MLKYVSAHNVPVPSAQVVPKFYVHLSGVSTIPIETIPIRRLGVMEAALAPPQVLEKSRRRPARPNVVFTSHCRRDDRHYRRFDVSSPS